MSQPTSPNTRREFLGMTGRIAAASALAGVAVPHVHAAEDNTIHVALIGCGGRGTGAASNALKAKNGSQVKLVAMADAFKDRLDKSLSGITKACPGQVDVPEDRRFVGLDAYRHAMDCLRPGGDVAIFATPLGFRWVHFGYAVQKGLNVFMEKPLTADGPTSRRMLELAAISEQKKLKVGVGLNSRHARNLQQLAPRIHDDIGDIVLMRGYRMHGPIVGFWEPKPAEMSEVEFQLRKFHGFLWASGGAYSDFYIHIIDHCCWMKGAWPVQAMGLGGRHYRGKCIDQNFDNYSIEYSFADGAKLILDGRSVNGAEKIYHSCAQGTKGYAVMSKSGDCGGPSSTYRGQLPEASKLIWESTGEKTESHQTEWDDLIAAIQNDQPFNEAKRGIEASVVTSMGRMAAHTGRSVSFEDMLNNKFEYAPGLDKLTFDGPAPVMPDAEGKYPIPQPGVVMDREY